MITHARTHIASAAAGVVVVVVVMDVLRLVIVCQATNGRTDGRVWWLVTLIDEALIVLSTARRSTC